MNRLFRIALLFVGCLCMTLTDVGCEMVSGWYLPAGCGRRIPTSSNNWFTIFLEDLDGNVVYDALVRYRREDGTRGVAECAAPTELGCDSYTFSPGSFEIVTFETAKVGYLPTELVLDLGETVTCEGPDSSVTLRVAPSDAVCSEEAVPSVTILILDADDTPLPGAAVSYDYNQGPVSEAPCRDEDLAIEECTEFTAGIEDAGMFVITATLDPYEPITEEVPVSVTEDGCHVVTEVVEFQLVE